MVPLLWTVAWSMAVIHSFGSNSWAAVSMLHKMTIKRNRNHNAKASQLRFSFGGLEGIRTLDPHNANVVRSQLRYKPVNYQLIIALPISVVKTKEAPVGNVIKLAALPSG